MSHRPAVAGRPRRSAVRDDDGHVGGRRLEAARVLRHDGRPVHPAGEVPQHREHILRLPHKGRHLCPPPAHPQRHAHAKPGARPWKVECGVIHIRRAVPCPDGRRVHVTGGHKRARVSKRGCAPVLDVCANRAAPRVVQEQPLRGGPHDVSPVFCDAERPPICAHRQRGGEAQHARLRVKNKQRGRGGVRGVEQP